MYDINYMYVKLKITRNVRHICQTPKYKICLYICIIHYGKLQKIFLTVHCNLCNLRVVVRKLHVAVILAKLHVGLNFKL